MSLFKGFTNIKNKGQYGIIKFYCVAVKDPLFVFYMILASKIKPYTTTPAFGHPSLV